LYWPHISYLCCTWYIPVQNILSPVRQNVKTRVEYPGPNEFRALLWDEFVVAFHFMFKLALNAGIQLTEPLLSNGQVGGIYEIRR
jgi:hypothetical protein